MYFQKKTIKLSNRTSYDHAIKTKKKMSFFESIYNMSIIEFETLREYIDENLAKKFIIEFIFSTKVSILFVKKSNEELRLCVNYRELNVIIIKNKYFLSRVEILLNQMHDVKIFIKVDIIWAYNALWIREKNEWKIAFHCRYELFEYKVMSFELINASITF